MMAARDRRAVFLGVIAIGAALLVRVGLAGVAGSERRLTLITETRHTAARAEAMLARAPEVDQRRQAAARWLTARADVFLDGETASEGVGSLRDVLSSWAVLHELTIEREDPRPDSMVGGLARVATMVRVRGREAGLIGWLEKIETGPRLLTVRTVTMRVTEPGVSADVLVEGWVVLGAHATP